MSLKDFSETFVEAREKFIDAAREAGATLHRYSRDDVRGRHGEELSCDVAILGPDDASRGVIVIVGTHGAEGYCGSAIQHRWLSRDMHQPGDTKVVLVHAINPWSFSFKTRGTENNVDLNRNFFTDAAGYERDNPSYDKLVPFYHAAEISAAGELAANKAYIEFLERHGARIEGESWEGQSRHPNGIYYTGKGPEWSNGIFRRIIREHLGNAERIGFIDWHTCVGRFGEVVYLVFDEEGSEERATAMGWWGLSGGAEGAYRAAAVPKYEGLLCKAIRQELPGAKVAGAVIEFGTVEDYTLFRADRLDRWLTFEGRDDPLHDQLRDDYKDVCCPRDVTWRRMVLAEGPAIMDRLIAGVHRWGIQ